MTDRVSVVYVVLDKLGGIASSVHELQAHGRRERFEYRTVLVDSRLSVDTRYPESMPCDFVKMAHELPLENVYSVVARFLSSLPSSGGVLVATDWLELAASRACDHGRAVLFVLSGDYDYYYDLAVRNEEVVDAFITVSRSIQDRLSSLLPNRRESIHCIPSGVMPSRAKRVDSQGSLRLLYTGRIDEAKGVLDLPMIDRALAERGVSVLWTVVGSGPDEERLKKLWVGPNLRWRGPLSLKESREAMAEHDVFVLPSRAEGLPVALLECMSTGMVPVVSDLPGPREVVSHGSTGFRPRAGHLSGFVDVIASLDADRELLETMGQAARALVEERYHVRQQVEAYEGLFERWRELRRGTRPRRAGRLGSRLDRKWIPNALVRFVRSRRQPELAARLKTRQSAH